MDFHYLVLWPLSKPKQRSRRKINSRFRRRSEMGLGGGVNRVKFRFAKGEVVIAMVKCPKKAPPQDEMLQPFLKLLARDMIKNPRRIVPLPARLLARAQAVTEGVEVDLDGPLTGDD